MKNKLKSLEVKLLLPSLIALIPVLGLLFWFGQTELEQRLQSKSHLLTEKAVELNERFADRIQQAEIALSTIAQNPVLYDLDLATCQNVAEQQYHVLSQQLANLLILDAQGKTIANAKSPSKLHDLHDRAYYQRAMQSKHFSIGDFTLGRTTNTPVLGMAYPMVINGQVVFLAASSIELSQISTEFAQVLAHSNLELTIVDSNGKLLTHWQQNKQFLPIGIDVANSAFVQKTLSQREGSVFEAPNLMGNESLVSYRPLVYDGQLYGYLALSYPLSEINAFTAQYHLAQFAIILFVFLSSMLLAALIVRRLIRKRLNPMLRVVERLRQGELGAQLPDDGSNDELSELTTRFNHMSTQIAEHQAHLFQLAYHDPLTELYNKSYMQNYLNVWVEARPVAHISLFLIDIDNFRLINDSLGHHTGDLLLQQLAQRLKLLSDESDLLAHLGGDEFAYVLLNRDKEQTQNFAKKVLQLFRQSLLVLEHELTITASIGIANYPDDAAGATHLFQHADAALHKAKQEGRDQFRCYSVEMKEALSERLVVENALRVALAKNEGLVLYYQPQVDVDGVVHSFEALIRWQQTPQVLVAPDAFIPIAEQSGLIVALGNWVLNEACQQMRRWLDAGYLVDYVAVNVSAMQLHMGDLVQEVAQALEKAGIPAHRLELEITESFVVKHPEQAIGVLQQLKAMGVALAMDDFGTGYSSMLYLKRLPLTRIKVDQGFVRNMLVDPHDIAIVGAIIALGHSFGLQVVAEGVESQEHIMRLRAMGCDMMQGYAFGKPVPALQAETLLSQVSV
ncbi:MAG: EAL domain-containing protein [Proteobacteria bacterium]|nr:EAL domain-containing protein [Pseudomonadota bacterium]